MFILSSCCEREISVPQIFNTKEEAQKKMREEFADTLGIKPEEIESILESDDEEYDGSEAAFNEDNAYCTNMNHDNCDWKIHEIDIPINHSWNEYAFEYCPNCDSEVFIHAHGTTRCPNCKMVLFPCSVCHDERGGCIEGASCPYETGYKKGEENRIPTMPDMSEEELNWCENNFNTY